MINAADLISPITDADIDWVCQLMNLQELDEPRKNYLKSLTTLDVSACPGSGKTTLLVAKLAIIARKWKHPTRGLCVLSHTNVAREEIERRLGGNEVCQKLLSYPHFIDTIHAFVNRFLATPWLLSSGYKLTAIDNDLTIGVRRRFLGHRYHTLNGYLGRLHLTFESLRLGNADFSNPLNGFPSGPHTPMHQLAAAAIKHSSEQGYFCYDEIFVLGGALLDQHPEISIILAQRFPFVLIDEMQDTSAMQNSFLSRMFSRNSPAICVHRVGDPNQAIYEGDALMGPDAFPDNARCLCISNSFRFDQSIANIANRLAFHEINPNGLIGVREIAAGETSSHTIFVFPDDDTSGVLDAYGQHLLETFPQETIRGSMVTAIGAVHKEYTDIPPGHRHYPKTVSHYWDGYQTSTASSTFKPETLAEYFMVAQLRRGIGRTLHRSVNYAAQGIAHLANLTAGHSVYGSQARVYREIDTNLGQQEASKRIYHDLIRRFIVDSEELNQAAWQTLNPDLLTLGESLGGVVRSQAVLDFLSWTVSPELLDQVAQADAQTSSTNIYRYTCETGLIDIRLGSIHMAKGQTHLATLILETYNNSHFLHSLLPWIQGRNSNGTEGMNVTAKKRLLSLYVAMTRPTHLLCLAIRRSSFGTDIQLTQAQERLASLGWTVKSI